LVGKPEGKRPLGRPRRRWEDNILLTEYCAGDKKSRGMRRVGHVALMGEMRGYTGFWWGNQKEREH